MKFGSKTDKEIRAHRNRSAGQERRIAREYADGYYAHLRGRQDAMLPVSGGAPLDTGQYILVREAAERLGVSTQYAYQLIKAGRIRAVRVGAKYTVWLVNSDSLPHKEVSK